MTLTICKCNHCSNEIEFESDRAGETIPCPHCGMDTLLYVPYTPPAPPQIQTATLQAPPGETLFFSDPAVMVTNTRFVTHGRFFPMTAISCVEVRPVRYRNLLLNCLSIFFFLGFLGSLPGGSDRTYTAALIWFIFFLMPFSVVMDRQWRPMFEVVITTHSGEVTALESRQRPYVNEIATAISNAIVHRG
jgi:DNA-directed RNA polymerase subunit RPC12/RpoP